MEKRHEPGRRTVLGAAALGAGAAVLAGAGQAQAAGPAERAAGPAARPAPAGRPGKLPVPLVVGHRGASGYRPEHTFGSYQLALDMGADVIEAGDLVPTKDGHLVCRHENDISATTDVADHREFAGRRTTKTVDGKKLTGWFTEDFTLAELKTLRAKERIPDVRQHNTLYNGHWQIPTFEEVLQWAEREGRRRGRPVWVYPETKHPTYFRKLGLGVEEPLAKLLRRYGRHTAHAPNFVQSFEPSSIQRLGRLGVKCPKVVLLDEPSVKPWDFVESGDPRTTADLLTPEGLKWISGFAQGIGPWLPQIIAQDEQGKLGKPTSLVRDAHAAGLVLHPYTVRNENNFLPLDFRVGKNPGDYGNSLAYFKALFATGIDGLFSDNPDTALLAAEEFRRP
ncbi:glycerophosphodiester phosphodiesterase [Streptomyces noursei]|uniref:glycerophosphodiester phosphodiesterase n=1 Tax=Streptomyces noursei TaxID=1971 RepID=UPI0016775E92|nr:glycerophosphodiester phosphodiesterase [Streptomyces noursei]MCZ1014656.1 glycerophosphodiester phosphodiesterase [Streptomyces noursei]GGW96709.1 glycerophosphoryl diester phosphodiesterase [Streptomyces noursei]